MKPLPLAVAALLGLLAGWLLWGRSGPVDPAIAAIDTVLVRDSAAARLADSLGRLLPAKDALIASLTAGAARERAARLAWADTADRLEGVIAARFANGDTLGAILGLRGQLDALGMAYQGCDREADSLRIADSVCVERSRVADNRHAVDSTRVRSLRRSLRNARKALVKLGREPRWSAGPVWGTDRLAPVGGYVDRVVGPVRVGVYVVDADRVRLFGTLGLRF